MNKSEFIKELSKQTSYNEEWCNTINNIVEDTFIIGKKNKEKIIEKFEKQINLENNLLKQFPSDINWDEELESVKNIAPFKYFIKWI